jgi:predicted  nucleic acid-binding Zn-ribbon protein
MHRLPYIALGLAVIALVLVAIPLQGRLRVLQNELGSTNAQLVQARAASAELEKLVATLKTELDAANRARTDFQTNLDEATSDNEQLRKDIDAAQTQSANAAKEAEAEHSKLQAALDQANAEIERLKTELEQHKTVPPVSVSPPPGE